MDQFGRTNSSSASQAPQASQQKSQASRSPPTFSQGQSTQGTLSSSQEPSHQGSASFGHGQDPRAVGSTSVQNRDVRAGSAFPQMQRPQSGSSQDRDVRSSTALPQMQNNQPGPSFQRNQDNGPQIGHPAPLNAPQSGVPTKLQPGEQRPPSISRRKYIKWQMVSGREKEEDTETIVLTDPKSTIFVDVRLKLATLTEARPGNHAQLEPEDIDWAFAGHTDSTPLGRDQLPYTRKVVFNHSIDSRSLRPEDIVDKAYMSWADDGTGDEIEFGSMVNPHTGDKQGYEERWSEDTIVPAAGQDSRLCIAMTTEQSDGTRGCVMVIGQWAQGIMRTGQGTLHIERWFSKAPDGFGQSQFGHQGQQGQQRQQNQDVYPSPQLSTAGLAEEGHDGWHLIARVGVPILPSPGSFVSKNLTDGATCVINGMNWTVRTVRRW